MEKNYCRTDLACEWKGDAEGGEEGVRISRQTVDGTEILTTLVEAGKGEESAGRAAGKYVTVFAERFWLREAKEYEQLYRLVAGELRRMAENALPRTPRTEWKILIAGLGNRFITSDALGPLTVDRLIATRHIRETNARLFHLIGNCEISLIAPGVVGQTGFEAAELIRGAAECARPDLILAIDALAARSCGRLGTTVQLSDRGILPGSGIGNHRKSIDRENMGTPVFSLGIPTVVSASALLAEALEEAGVDTEDRRLTVRLEEGRDFFVSPKECDTIVSEGAKLLADAISTAFRL